MNSNKYHVEELEGVACHRWIWEQVNKARYNARADRLGMVKLCYAGDRDDILIMSRRDFERWFGDLPTGGTQ